MTEAEIRNSPLLPPNTARMGCHFSPTGPGLSQLPSSLPRGGMLILDDREPFQNHTPAQIAQELKDTLDRLGCDSLLLDFERPPTPQTQKLGALLAQVLPCPVGMPPAYGVGIPFLSPCPLHIPLEDYLRPFQGREIWLEWMVQAQTITVTPQGTALGPAKDKPDRGWYDQHLQCMAAMDTTPEGVIFTLFDTPDTLEKKMTQAQKLGVTRRIGLYQDFPVFAK